MTQLFYAGKGEEKEKMEEEKEKVESRWVRLFKRRGKEEGRGRLQQ
jgi:hypothetical protein